MKQSSCRLIGALAVVILSSCSAEDPAPVRSPSPNFAGAQDTSGATQSTELHREVFAYRGAARDPFRSLISANDANLRPFFEDLRLISVAYDGAFPSRSIAVVRDTTLNDRYTIRVGDRLGRLQVIEIRPGQVVLTRENLGVSEQVTLETRRRGGQGGME
jgi:hypothetical protein